ncbi:MAG: helix-turn-helix domain-containing protein [Methylococcales bacterium]
MNQQPSKRSFTYHEQETMWQLWSQGKSLSEIGRQLSKHAGSVFCYLQKPDGIKPPAPNRSVRDLSLQEREEISRGISANLSLRAIARNLNRAASTVTREINRNGGVSKYRAVTADRRAWTKAKRPKTCKLNDNANLRTIVSERMAFDGVDHFFRCLKFEQQNYAKMKTNTLANADQFMLYFQAATVTTPR